MLNYIFVCCLLTSQIEINFAENSSTEVKSNQNDEGLLTIQAELLEIQDDIISITATMGLAENLDSILNKIDITEESFQLIKDELANYSVEIDECSRSALTMLKNQYEAVSSQLTNLKIHLKEFKQKRIPSNILADIRGLRFKSAEENLKRINNFTDVLKIIQDVYANSLDNFDLLANLTESFTDIDLICNSVKALQQELSRNKHNDPYKWMRLAKIIEAGVINQPIVPSTTKAFAQDVESELYHSIRMFTLNALNASVSKGAFEKYGKMDNLTTAVYIFDPSQSESIIEEFVHTTFEFERPKNIFDIITSHKFIQQRVRGLTVLFWKLKDSYKINNDVTFNIASALYEINSDDEFVKLSRAMRVGVTRIIETLPTCARNLFFLPSLCLWNKAKEQYLTAANSSYLNDKKRRNIFLSEDSLPESHWHVKNVGDSFLFSSSIHSNEYLYAADFDFNRDWRYVFSWVPGNNTDKQSKWNIRLDGDYCYIRSTPFYEHLVSSNYKIVEDVNLNYVFTWVPRTSIANQEFLWQIRKCD